MRLPEAREDGNAVLEFVALSVVVLLPFVYIVMSVFSVQSASFGVTQAAREAGRVLATSTSVGDGLRSARRAVALALADQGVGGTPTLAVVPAGASCTGASGTAAASLAPGARFTVCVSDEVPLPYTDGRLLHAVHPSVHVQAAALVSVDTYRSAGS